jgi:hypothetical protein
MGQEFGGPIDSNEILTAFKRISLRVEVCQTQCAAHRSGMPSRYHVYVDDDP